MKRTLTLLAAGLSFYTCTAQQFSGGFRTGASHWMDKQEGKCFTNSAEGQNITWDKELFVRYNTKGKLAFEVSIGHYAFNNNYKPEQDGFTIPEYRLLNVNERSQNLELNLSAQYDVTCPVLQEKCPVMKRLKSYVGVLLTPTLSRNRLKTSYIDGVSEGSVQQSVSSKDEMALWTGLSHTMIYNLCDHMYVTTAVRLQIDPNRFFDNSGTLRERDGRAGFQIGVGYKL